MLLLRLTLKYDWPRTDVFLCINRTKKLYNIFLQGSISNSIITRNNDKWYNYHDKWYIQLNFFLHIVQFLTLLDTYQYFLPYFVKHWFTLFTIDLRAYAPGPDFLSPRPHVVQPFRPSCINVWSLYFHLQHWLFNISDPPAYASGPHFYQSDPSLFDAVDGLTKPDKEKHATLIAIEPVSRVVTVTSTYLRYSRMEHLRWSVNMFFI